MNELERKIKGKIPGEDTKITTKNSFCDICAPGPHCGVTCYLKDNVIIKVEGTKDHPCNHGLLCTKGQANREYIYRKDRIQTPLKRIGKRGEGKFEPISWEEAFCFAAKNLNSIKQNFGPESVAFFSGYEKWYRPFLERLCYAFGSPNYGTESSSCFTSSVMSWRIATGQDAMRTDLAHAGLFVGWCCNAYYNAHLALNGMQKAHENGMKVIIIDPRITPAVEKLADLHLRPRPGTDGALALSLGHELIINDWINHDFIETSVYGYEEYKSYVMDFTPEKGEELTGVPASQIRQAAKMMHENGPVAINQSSAALVHHKNGMQNHRAVMALSALLGTYDQPGGITPNYLTYAHSMGGFTTMEPEFGLEIYPKEAPLPVGGEKFPLWQKLVGEMQSNDLARQILEEKPYPVKAIWAHGMNYRMFNGDTHLKEALNKLDFFVDIDLFLTDTAKMADLVLPCCSSFERSEFKVWPGFCQYTEPVIAPLYESRSDTDIIFSLANALQLDDPFITSDYDTCVSYMLRNTKIDLSELKKDTQHPIKVPGFTPIKIGEAKIKTPTGKFELYSTIIAELNNPDLDPLPTYLPSLDDVDHTIYPMVLVTGARLPNALHSRCHNVPWLRSLRPDPMADISTTDARELGIEPGELICLRTTEGELQLKVNPTLRVPKGCVFLYHGYSDADANSIIPWGHNDPYSGFPGYRSCHCNITKRQKEVSHETNL